MTGYLARDLLALAMMLVMTAIGAWLLFWSIRALVRALRARWGSPTPVDEVSSTRGYADVVGEARVLEGDPFEAPFTGEPAVYCQYEVRRTDDGWTVTDDAIGGRFVLEGDHDRVVVDPEAFSIVGPAEVPLTTGPNRGFPRSVSRRLEDVGIHVDATPELDPANTNRYREYIERRLEPGTRVRAIGQWDDDGSTPVVAADSADDEGNQLVVENGPVTREQVKQACIGIGLGTAFAVPGVLGIGVSLFRLL